MSEKKMSNDELLAELDNARRLLVKKDEELTAETARKYDTVRDQSRILDAFFDNTITPLVVLDRDFNFIMVNPAYARACKRDISQFEGKNHFDLYPSDAKLLFEEVVEMKIPYQAIARPFRFSEQPELETTYWDWTLVPILDRDGEVDILVFSLVDVTKSKRAEIALNESNALLHALGQAQASYISDTNPNDLFDNLLGELLKLTGSEYGFIGQILKDDKGEPYLKNFATTNIAWNKETKAFYEENKESGLKFSNLKSLFGLVITTGKQVISNDAPNDKRGCGIPEGHPPLKSFLGLPCYVKDRLVGMVAFANRAGGYDDKIIEQLDPLLTTTANIIEAYRNDIQRKETEETLKKTEERFKKAQEIAHVGTWDWDPNSGALIWTDEIYKILGYLPGEIEPSYELFLKRVHPEDREALDEAVKAALKNKQPYNIDCRIVRKDGSMVDANAQGDVYFDKDGKPERMLGHLADITERKLAGKALEESEEFLSIAQEIAHIGHWKLDPLTNEVSSSDELLNIFGLTKENATFEAFVEAVHPEDREFDVSTIQNGIAKGEGWDIEHRLLMKDGTIKTVHAIGHVHTDETGKTVEVIGTVQDITERKKIEDSLKVERERLFSILDSFPGFVYLQAEDYTIPFANKKFIDHYGDPAGKTCHELMWDREKPCDQCRTFEVFKTKKPIEWISDHPERESVYQVYDHPFIDTDGTLLVLELSIDITERRKAEEKLAKSEQLLQSVLDNSTTIVYVKDKDGKYLLINSMFEKIFHIDRRDVIGMTDYDLFSKEMAKSFRANDLKVLEMNEQIEFEEVVPQDKGNHTYISIKFPLRDSADNPYAVCGISTDITKRTRVEADTLKMQKLESIGVLAGGIAHDFNNLLTGILGNVSFSMMDLDHDDKIYARLKEAERASLIARDLTQQLLTFAKGGEPVMETYTIGNLIKEPAELALAGAKNKCVFAFAGDLPCVEADMGQIGQVINNLVINADQAMDEGGVIKISATRKKVDKSDHLPIKSGEYVLIEVEDHGTGISDEHISKVFDPYFTTKQKGSGLGLASVYSIVMKHGGHIELSSEVGVGTTFSIYLPASNKKAHATKKKEMKIIHGNGKVLIMDDEEIIRDLLSEFLVQLGYEAESVKDGAQAIKTYMEAKKAGKPFKAIIMDLTIQGGMGGKETIKLLLKEDPEAKAIVSSGYSNDPVVSNYKEFGFSGYLNKPYKVLMLSKVLDDVINDRGK